MLARLCPRLRLTRPLAFSTTASVRNESPSALGELAGVLEGQALADKGKEKPQETIRPVHEYKPIMPNSFIRPYDLSLDGRRFKERRMSRAPAIPPTTRDARKQDVFYQLGIDPLKYALHPAVLSPFLTEMGMIMPRRMTALTSKSQRRVAKAIRRAKMMGVIPLHSRMRNYGNMF
ncbi:hypothetical protein B0H19DRAFT_1269807 [Mycena capillaripes]|nr:hypothetical protein B0H19DRAFT_1269807 [Mycena capillaripes]